MSLFAELKKRRVFRVAGAYLVGAWVVLQVADTLFPALHLPPWTVTLVAGIVVIGFPIALALGWAFDLTPGGVERAPSAGASLRFPVRAAMVGTILVTLGVGSFVLVRRRAVASRLDANAVMVLPFRVSGDAALAVMREGMVDLLSAKLTGEGGPRAIDSRTSLSAWRRKVENERDDMPAADAVHLARSVGAGQVLLGEIVGTPGKVIVNAKLLSALDGTEIAKAADDAPPDSMLQIVDRLVAKLLSAQSGQAHRVEALLSESLPAVQAYLEGQRLFRRGNHDAASLKFKAALDTDSTFALAGLGLALARAWAGYGEDFQRGRDAAWKFRERLPLPDREFVTAWVGENFPAPTADPVRLAAWQRIVASAPDRIEAWYALGDLYYHKGDPMNIADSDQKALDAWDKALKLDSAYVPAIAHQVPVYAARGDTAQVRKLSEWLFGRVQPEMRTRNTAAWVAATALEDEKWLKELRATVDSVTSSNARNIALEIVLLGLKQDDVPLMIETSFKAARNPEETQNSAILGLTQLLNMGRPKAAMELMAKGEKESPGLMNFLLVGWGTTYIDLDSATVAAAASHPQVKGSTDPHDVCVLSTYHIVQGDFSNVRLVLDSMRAAVAREPNLAPRVGVCVYAHEAALKVYEKAPDASAAVARLDSVLLNSSVSTIWREDFAYESMRLHLALGELEEALAAAKRVQRDQGFARAPLLLERARIASRLGKRDEAIETYQMYLKMRANPEPGRAAEITARARSELAALVGERQ
jgi:tetratricopeptide (TPR) repeat protein